MPVKLIQITWIAPDLTSDEEWVHPADVNEFLQALRETGCTEVKIHRD